DYPLPWDSTTVLDYNKWDVTYNIEELKDNSKKRVSRNKIFNLITSNAQIMSREINSPKSLQLSKLMEEQKTTRDLGDGINKLLDSTNLFEVEIPKGEMEEGDYSDRKDKMEAYLKTLSKDIYAEEAVNILGDMNEEIK
ncbi:MAG: carboxy terminal-processing peptidase, partial [Brevinematales bacterium]